MELKIQSLMGIFWSVIEKFGNRFFTLLIFFVLANLLSPEVFGVVAIVNSILAFVSIFVDQGFTTAIVQKENPSERFLATAFWGNIGISLLLATVFILMGPAVARIYEIPELTLYIRVISLSFIVGAFSRVQNALFIKEMKFRLLAIRRLIGTLSGGIVGVTMALNGYGVWSLIGYQLTTMTVLTIVLAIQSQWRPSFQFDGKAYRELFRFGANVLGNNLLFYSQLHLINLLIGYFLGTTALGYYSIANKVFVTFKDMVINTFSRIALPLFSKIQGDDQLRSDVFYKLVARVILLIIPFCLGLVVLFPDIVPIFLNEDWIPAIPLVQVLLGACIFTIIPSFINDFLLGTGWAGRSLRMNLLNTGLYLTLVLIGTQIGLVETTIGVGISYLLSVPISLAILHAVIPVRISQILRLHLKAFVAGGLIIVLLLGLDPFLRGNPTIALTIKGCLFLFLMFGSIRIFQPGLLEDARSVGGQMFSKIPRFSKN